MGIALSKSAEIIANILAQSIPQRKLYKTLTTYGIKALEAATLARQHANLIAVRLQVERALNKLENKRNQAFFGDILSKLRGDPETFRQAVQEWLSKHEIDRQLVAQRALEDAASISQQLATQMARGIQIIDPDQSLWDLEKIPGINPDFIAAIKNCNQGLAEYEQRVADYIATNRDDEGAKSRAALRARATRDYLLDCNKYADGRYIPAFGQSQGDRNVIKENPLGQQQKSDEELFNEGASFDVNIQCTGDLRESYDAETKGGWEFSHTTWGRDLDPGVWYLTFDGKHTIYEPALPRANIPNDLEFIS